MRRGRLHVKPTTVEQTTTSNLRNPDGSAEELTPTTAGERTLSLLDFGAGSKRDRDLFGHDRSSL